MPFRIGIDIGGTFTDFTVMDAEGRVTLWKEESTPNRPADAISAGLEALAHDRGLTLDGFLGQTSLLVHGTTIATNTVIQRNGPTIGLLCTSGFRDILHFRDGFKPERFNVHLPHPQEFVDRYLRLGVTERIDKDGNVLIPLDEQEVRELAARFRESEVAAVAVAFLWSIVNPTHERRAAEILAEELPDAHIVCSSDVLPEIREWERTSATVLSSYVLPGIYDYLRQLESTLRDGGLERPPLIMQINGGCASVTEILRRPVYVLASGPAAAPAAALHHAAAGGDGNLVTADIGGTSFDVCLIRGGRPAMSRTIQVEHQPIGVAGVDVHSVGAGGGSIAWLDSGGALRVGPRSAGAVPGPASYAQGGEEPTVTDANVVLGYLTPDAFLGGRRVLRLDLAEQAVTRIADGLGISTLQAGAGIIRVVNANMVAAIHAVSIERGVDPRRYLLVVGGGAGGLHAAQLARELGMRRVLVPREAGTFCAFGMTVTDVRHDFAQALHALSSAAAGSDIDAVFATLEDEARARLLEEGFTEDQIHLERFVDARYPGQVHELTVPAVRSATNGETDLRAVERVFHDEHEAQFTYARRELPVEFLHWRVSALGRMPLPPSNGSGGHRRTLAQPAGECEAYFESVGGLVATATYSALDLTAGAFLEGPAIVQAPTTTVVVDPGDALSVRADGDFLIEIGAAA